MKTIFLSFRPSPSFLNAMYSAKIINAILICFLSLASCQKQVSERQNPVDRNLNQNENFSATNVESSVSYKTGEKYDITAKVTGVVFPLGITKIQEFSDRSTLDVQKTKTGQTYVVIEGAVTYQPSSVSYVIDRNETIWQFDIGRCTIVVHIIKDKWGNTSYGWVEKYCY